ncbi:MAG TPA: hypothetical protein VIG72_06705 [Pontibacter sp.]
MKKKILFSGFCLFATATTLLAQDSLSVKPVATKPYKLALGLRYSPGGPAADFGFTAKYFIGAQSALEAQATKFSYSDSYMATVSYVWQPQLLTSSGLRPYISAGIGAMRYHDQHPDNSFIKTNPVAVVNAGVEYKFRRAPVALSLDYRAPVLRYDNSPYQSRKPLSDYGNLGIGVKLLLR